jgi:RNA polymerase sigma factor (sigma-70 family)
VSRAVTGTAGQGRCVSDDEELERFCAAAYPPLVAALTHHVGDRWVAEELAQEALIRACDHWTRVHQLASPLGWTFRVGANLGSSYFRRRAAERRAGRRHGAGQVVHHDPDGADRLAVRDALARLTGRQREVVILRFYLGLTTEEVATATGATAGAVRALTHRAVRLLREELGVTADVEEVTDAP